MADLEAFHLNSAVKHECHIPTESSIALTADLVSACVIRCCGLMDLPDFRVLRCKILQRGQHL